MSKTLPSDTQNSIQVLLENSIDPTVIGKRVGVHRNTVNRYANKWMHNRIRTVVGIIVRMFCNFIRFALYLCSQIR